MVLRSALEDCCANRTDTQAIYTLVNLISLIIVLV